MSGAGEDGQEWEDDLVVPTLGVPTSPLVKVIGLDVESNVKHQVFWQTLQNRVEQGDSVVRYQRCTADTVNFPPRKDKPQRQLGITEEDYIPPGIIKLNWPTKHALKIPAVLVVFVQLEWEAEDWEQKEKECAHLFQRLREARNNRSTRFVAILEQSKPQASVDEETITRRAHTFRTACELRHRSSLFTLDMPQSQIPTAVEKLDAIFHDLARQHYSDEMQRVEQHMAIANQATEHMLFVRYHFKVAFFNELKGIRREAIARYQRALEFLSHVGYTAARAAEIKAVAGLLVARMCRCLFDTSSPLEAIAAFTSHVAAYRRRAVAGESTAAHAAWMAQQYTTFGTLFKDAVDRGLGAVMLQHPGYFFKFAAEFAARRMAAVSAAAAHAPGTVTAATKTYIGQVTYSCEAAPDASQTQLFKWHEQQYPHAATTLRLFTTARDLFARFCFTKQAAVVNGQIVAKEKQLTKMLTILDLQRAKYLTLQHNFADASSLLYEAAAAFRRDRWWSLLRDALLLLKQCTWALGDSHGFCAVCLELCAPSIPLSAEDKTLAQTAVDDVVQGTHVEESLSDDLPVAFGAAAGADDATKAPDGGDEEEGAAASETSGDVISMADVLAAVECKVVLYEPDIEAHNRIRLCVAFRSSLPLPLRVTTIRPVLSFTTGGTSTEGADGGDEEEEDVRITGAPTQTTALIPQSTKVVEMYVAPPTRTSPAAAVVCSGVHASIAGHHPITLHWPVETTSDRAAVPASQLTALKWRVVPSVPRMTFVSKSSGLRITHDHNPPALVGERYTVDITVANTKACTATAVTLRVEAVGAEGSALTVDELCVTVDGEEHSSSNDRLTVSLADIEANGSRAVSVRVLSSAAGHLSLHARVEYRMRDVGCAVEDELGLPVATPLQSNFTLLDTQGNTLDQRASLPAGQDICIGIKLETPQSERLEVVDTWVAVPWCNTHFRPHRITAGPEGIAAGEVVRDMVHIPLPPLSPAAQPTTTALGSFHVKWRRAGVKDAETVEATSTLPMIDVHPSALQCHLHAPSSATALEPLQIALYIKNDSMTLQELDVSVAASQHFKFSGHRRVSLRVLPDAVCPGQGSETLVFNAIPLAAGVHPLPDIRLHDRRTAEPVRVLGATEILVLP